MNRPMVRTQLSRSYRVLHCVSYRIESYIIIFLFRIKRRDVVSGETEMDVFIRSPSGR